MSKVPRHSRLRLVGLILASGLFAFGVAPERVQAAGARLDGVRSGRHEGYTRVVLDLRGTVPYAIEEDEAKGQVDVVVRGASLGAAKPPDLSDDPLLATVELRPKGRNVTVRLRTRGTPAEVRHFTLAQPYRVVVDVYDPKVAPPKAAAAVAPGPSAVKPPPAKPSVSKAAPKVREAPKPALAAAPTPVPVDAPKPAPETPKDLPTPPLAATDGKSAPLVAARTLDPNYVVPPPSQDEFDEFDEFDPFEEQDHAPAPAEKGPAVGSAEGGDVLRRLSIVRRGVFDPVIIAEPTHRLVLQMVQDALPHDIWSRLEQASEFMEAGKLDEAGEIYRAILAQHGAGEFGALLWTAYGDTRVWSSLVTGHERYIEAIDAYKRARGLAQTPPLALEFRLATAYHLIRFTHEATEEYERAVANNPGTMYEAYGEMELGKLELVEGKYFDAFRRLVRLVGRVQGDAKRDALLLLAEANYRHENYFFALDNYRELESNWPGEISGRIDTALHYALTLGRNGVYEDAIARLQQLLDRLPNRPDLMLQVARFYRDLGKQNEAESYYRRIAGDFDGKEPGFRARVALAEMRFSKEKGAERDEPLAEALDLVYADYKSRSYAAELLLRIGRIYLSIDQPKLALDRLNLLGRRFPESVWAAQARDPRDRAVVLWFDRLVAQGDANALVNFFRTEHKFFLGTFRGGYYHRHAAEAMTQVGSLGEAADTYGEASAIMITGPAREIFEVRRLQILFELGRVDEARQVIDSYLEEYPDGVYRAEALIAKGGYLERTDLWKEAQVEFDKAVVAAKDPVVRARALTGAGYCHWRLQEYAEAVPVYREAVLAWPADRRSSDEDRRFVADAYYHLALSQFALRHFEEAILAFREVVGTHPDAERVAWSRFYEARSLEQLGRDGEALEILDALAKESQDGLFRRAVEQMAAEIRWPTERARLAQRWKDGT